MARREDPTTVFHDQARMDELERLSAVETLKGLEGAERVTLGDLVRYLEERKLWHQFAKITMKDLRDAFPPEPGSSGRRQTAKARRKDRLLEDELGRALDERASARRTQRESTGPKFDADEVAHRVLPFLEANGDVTIDEIEEYVKLDPHFADLGRRELRSHLEGLVKAGRLERVGTGRNAVYSAL